MCLPFVSSPTPFISVGMHVLNVFVVTLCYANVLMPPHLTKSPNSYIAIAFIVHTYL